MTHHHGNKDDNGMHGSHGEGCGCGCNHAPDHDHDHGHVHGPDCGCGHEHGHAHDAAGGPKQYHSACFEAVLEVVAENETAEAVHGWIFNGAEWFVHAWAELEGHVFDLTEVRKPLDRAAYYAANQVREAALRRYTRLEFFTNMAEMGHVGPYDEEFFFTTVTKTDPLAKG